MTKDRIKKLENKFVVTVPKSLKLVFINPGDDKEKILKNYNKKDILIIEFV